jgi:hypothetical protein
MAEGLTDEGLGEEGFALLESQLGPVQPLRFMARVSRQPFDYQRWREERFEKLSIDEAIAEAKRHGNQRCTKTPCGALPAMKLKYLGDAKDSFKWDYHDYLTSQLGYSVLKVVPMRTPDDASNDGQTNAADFPARNSIIDLCGELRRCRALELIRCLPTITRACYRVELHSPKIFLTKGNRREYFSDLRTAAHEVLFLDPDNGFEPKRSCSEKHLLYSDLAAILREASETAMISVFHHFRRVSFANDYVRIRERISRGHTAAIYWRSLMFVAVAKKPERIENVEAVNRRYAKDHPVKILEAKLCVPGNSSAETNLRLFAQ